MSASSVNYLIVMLLAIQVLTIWVLGIGVLMWVNGGRDKAASPIERQQDKPSEAFREPALDSPCPAGVEDSGTPQEQGNRRGINLLQGHPGKLASDDGAEGERLKTSPENPVGDASKGRQGAYYIAYKKGLLALHQRKYAEAIQHFSRSIDLNPDYKLAYRFRGEAYLWNGDKDKALADLQKNGFLKGN